MVARPGIRGVAETQRGGAHASEPGERRGRGAPASGPGGESEGRSPWRREEMSDEVKNYITPGGYRRLQEELARLWKVERPPCVPARDVGSGQRRSLRRTAGTTSTASENCAKSIDVSATCRRAWTAPWLLTTQARPTSASSLARPSRSSTRAATNVRSPSSAWTSSIPATRACPAALSSGQNAPQDPRGRHRLTLRAPRGPERLEIVAVRYDDLR